MKSFDVSRSALSLCAAALLAGCGGSQPPIGAPGAMPQSRAIAARSDSTSYTIVYSFLGSPDGGIPAASLLDVGGTLYGTTTQGGSYMYGYCGYRAYYHGCGTVFSVTTGGTEKVLHNFRYKDDGSVPMAGLIDVGGTLYGTTSQGGKYASRCGVEDDYYGCGTVFSITPAGTENVLHSFSGRGDGSDPDASLTDVKGMLYGTTREGGQSVCVTISSSFRIGCGTVFSITTGGTVTIVHSFGNRRHAHWPRGRVIEKDGKLYGTTVAGGAYSSSCSTYNRGCGTVFSVTQSGAQKALHSFGEGADGREPAAGLIEVHGTFYGTTCGGGAYGNGTVFSITPDGTEKVLYSFGGGSDGAEPFADLINVNGTLYSTTYGGGAYGGGTVFSITLSGAEKVLHNFGAKGDGSGPVAGLINVDGTLYGTTEGGGTQGSGTVFALKP